jgi:DNA-binding LacI/PurR family transcriptional regulator
MVYEHNHRDSGPTQAQIARRLGVTQASVSLALQGSEKISPALRERVRAAAEACGYRPDAALRALVRRRWRMPEHLSFAYLGHEAEPRREMYFGAVQRHCARLGIGVWYMHWPPGGDDAARRALDRRRVSGVLVGHTFDHRRRGLDENRWRIVHCGMLMRPATGDVVMPDLVGGVATAYQRLVALGYRRIGAVHLREPYESDELIASGLWILERRIANAQRFTTCIATTLDQALSWMRDARCEALLGTPTLWQSARRQLSLPHAALGAGTGQRLAGTVMPVDEIAAYAIDLLLDKLRDRGRGPGGLRLHLVEMPWRDGPTMPAAPNRRRRTEALYSTMT